MTRFIFTIFFIAFGFNPAFAEKATVIAVFDGDSLNVEIKGEKVRVKLYGIDAPENGQKGNSAATRFLKNHVLNSPVEFKEMGKDGFDRTLAILNVADYKFSVNASMVANGYAWVKPDECNIADCAKMQKMESKARQLKLGIWSGFNLVPPWEFTKQQIR